jgi:hypothetical protein
MYAYAIMQAARMALALHTPNKDVADLQGERRVRSAGTNLNTRRAALEAWCRWTLMCLLCKDMELSAQKNDGSLSTSARVLHNGDEPVPLINVMLY